MSSSQIQELTMHFQRFSQPGDFEDDPTIPQELKLKTDLDNIESLTLSSAGIQVDQDALLSWDDIYNERIVPVGSASDETIYGTFHSTKLHFRFECPLGRLDIPMSSLDISAWKLDLMLYIFRGRHDLLQSGYP